MAFFQVKAEVPLPLESSLMIMLRLGLSILKLIHLIKLGVLLIIVSIIPMKISIWPEMTIGILIKGLNSMIFHLFKTNSIY